MDRLRSALSGRYTIDHEIGHGGMATVYLAEDVRHGRKVAVKVLRPELAESLGTERFLQEIAIAARLNHPNILPLHDSGEAEGFLYYVMPYIEGETIRDRLVSEKQLPVEDVVEITKEVSAALDYAHRQGVVHRDIKPENILIHEGKALVADFGIALAVSVAGGDRLTETGMVVGTPAYMSPEQSSGESHLDARSDVYSLATVVYEMLTGQPPFTGPTAQAIIARRLSETPPSIRVVREGVSPGLEQVVHKALSGVPADRYKTAREFAEELEKPSEVVVVPNKSGRRIGAVVVGVAVVVALVLGWVSLVNDGDGSEVIELDPNLVAVVPFRVTSDDPSLREWGQAMPDLFSLALDGRSGLPLAADVGGVLRLWQELHAEHEPTADELRALAARVGAGSVVSGTVVGNRENMTLVATLRSVRDSREHTESVIGPGDNIQTLVQELAVQLMLAAWDVDLEALVPATETVPLEALKAYLAGEQAWRRYRELGREPAIRHFNRALDIDSTFVHAAFALQQVSRLQGACTSDLCEAARERGPRLTWELRDQLNESDRAFVTMLREEEAARGNSKRRFKVVMDAADQWPNNKDVLNGLILRFYNAGAGLGVADWQERGFNAFDRMYRLEGRTEPPTGWEAGWPLEFSVGAPDSARTRRYAALYVTDNDSVLSSSHFFAYSFLGDSAGLAKMWQRADEWCTSEGLLGIGGFHLQSGLPLDGWARCINWFDSLKVTRQERGRVLRARADLAYFQGRELESVAYMDSARNEELDGDNFLLVSPILYWMLGPGYHSAAAASAAVIDSINRGHPGSGLSGWLNSYDRTCFASLWQVGSTDGDTSRVRDAIDWLSSHGAERGVAPEHNDCARLLEALLEARDTTQTGVPVLARLDSIMPEVGWMRQGSVSWLMNLTIARLWASHGEWDKALAALDRTAVWWRSIEIPAVRRLEGRVAAMVGDTARAIRAYTHYLTLRTDPDPGPLAEEVEAVRRELAVLVGERGGQ